MATRILTRKVDRLAEYQSPRSRVVGCVTRLRRHHRNKTRTRVVNTEKRVGGVSQRRTRVAMDVAVAGQGEGKTSVRQAARDNHTATNLRASYGRRRNVNSRQAERNRRRRMNLLVEPNRNRETRTRTRMAARTVLRAEDIVAKVGVGRGDVNADNRRRRTV